jgi:hypothetical protein
MTVKILQRILLLGLGLFLAVGDGHSTTLIVQREISVSRAPAGRADIRGTDLPASGVTVELCSTDWKSVLASTKTDGHGHFSLKRPATGKLFYVRLSAPGMDIYQLRVRIERHAAQELTIHLSIAT